MEFVDCTEEYWEFVRLLRMDDRVKDAFIKNENISSEQQIEYMSENSQFYRIALIQNTPVGYIGVIDDDIRICVDPSFQNKKIGSFMLNKAMEIWPNAFAKVKVDNEKSKSFFESCGFKLKYFIYEKDETQSI